MSAGMGYSRGDMIIEDEVWLGYRVIGWTVCGWAMGR